MNSDNLFRHYQIIAGVSVIFSFLLTTSGCKETTNAPDVGSLSDPAVQPMVVSTLPVEGSIGPFNLFDPWDGWGKPHFVLTFNKLMDKRSFTTTSFKILGSDAKTSVRIWIPYYDGPIEEPLPVVADSFDNVLAFEIFDSTQYGLMHYRLARQYTVILDSTVKDINGNHLASPYIFNYLPEPYFRVVGMNPAQSTRDVSCIIAPEIYFNSRVTESIIANLHFSPAPRGTWRVSSYDSKSVYFSHAQSLPFNTNFVLTLDGTARDAEGNPIDREYADSFSTGGFRVSSTFPSNGSTNVNLSGTVQLVFTGFVNTNTFYSGFSISPPVVFNFLGLYSPTPYIVFYALDGFRQNTTYTMQISSSVKAIDGTPAVPITSTFTTAPFTVQGYPDDGSTNISRMTSIRIYSNGIINWETMRPAFAISSIVQGSISSIDDHSFYYRPDVPLEANTLYTVTISTTLATKAGDHLGTPYSFSFTTGE